MVELFEKSRYFRKILTLVEIVETFRFWSKLLKISIWVKFCENVGFGQNVRKSRFWSKFAKISILVQICEKCRFWSKFAKISTLVEIFRKTRFCLNFEKSQISSIFSKNPHFRDISIKVEIWRKSLFYCQNLRKSRFWSKWAKISISVEIARFSILVEIFKKSWVCWNFQKFRFCLKLSKNLDFGRNLTKSRF